MVVKSSGVDLNDSKLWLKGTKVQTVKVVAQMQVRVNILFRMSSSRAIVQIWLLCAIYLTLLFYS